MTASGLWNRLLIRFSLGLHVVHAARHDDGAAVSPWYASAHHNITLAAHDYLKEDADQGKDLAIVIGGLVVLGLILREGDAPGPPSFFV